MIEVLNPDDAQALSSFARAISATDWPHDPTADQAAIGALERATSIDPKRTSAWTNLATYRCRQGQFAAAVTAARRALALDSEQVGARNALAFALVELERPYAAHSHLVQLLDADAEGFGEQFRIRAVRIKLRARQEQTPEIERRALVLRRVLCERFPESDVHHRGYAAALARTAEWDDLVSEARRWSSVRPRDDSAWRSLASVLMNRELPTQLRAPAMAAYVAKQSAQLAGRSVSTLGLWAEAEFRNSRTALAIQIAEDALALAKSEASKYQGYLNKRLGVYRAKLARSK